jgi:hypothetical protein
MGLPFVVLGREHGAIQARRRSAPQHPQIFKPGHQYRWQPGQSGNPSGLPAALVAFQEAFAAALAGEGTPEELAQMIWAAARKGESWAVLKLAERFEWQRAEAEGEAELVVKVVYVDRNNVVIAEDASGPAIEEVQRLLPGPESGQDYSGHGPDDANGTGKAAGGMV